MRKYRDTFAKRCSRARKGGQLQASESLPKVPDCRKKKEERGIFWSRLDSDLAVARLSLKRRDLETDSSSSRWGGCPFFTPGGGKGKIFTLLHRFLLRQRDPRSVRKIYECSLSAREASSPPHERKGEGKDFSPVAGS